METPTSDIEKEATEIQWSKYANYYDDMCDYNPSYQEMMELVVSKVQSEKLPDNSKVLDIGAGTGNLIARLALEKPNWVFTHLDYDSGMNRKAEAKYKKRNLNNVSILEQSAEDAVFENESFDLILSTNAIYAIPNYQELLKNTYSWLANSGAFVAVDFGRPQNTNDWVLYVARTSVLQRGIGATIRFFRKNWEAARQNRRTSSAQEEGNYWVHDNEEFEKLLQQVGFQVTYSAECYRGYSDIAVCRKS